MVSHARAADVAQIAPHALVAAREGWGQTARGLIREMDADWVMETNGTCQRQVFVTLKVSALPAIDIISVVFQSASSALHFSLRYCTFGTLSIWSKNCN